MTLFPLCMNSIAIRGKNRRLLIHQIRKEISEQLYDVTIVVSGPAGQLD